MYERRSVPGFDADKLQVGDDGSVWTKPRGRWRQLKPRREKYTLGVLVRFGPRRRNLSVARLVCRAFHGPQPLGCVPFHYPDPSKDNCRADNLRWAPRGTKDLGKRQWSQHRFPSGEQHPFAVLTDSQVAEIRSLRADGWTLRELADEFETSHSTIHSMVTGKTRKHVLDLEGEATS
jgi:hypothetical protein